MCCFTALFPRVLFLQCFKAHLITPITALGRFFDPYLIWTLCLSYPKKRTFQVSHWWHFVTAQCKWVRLWGFATGWVSQLFACGFSGCGSANMNWGGGNWCERSLVTSLSSHRLWGADWLVGREFHVRCPYVLARMGSSILRCFGQSVASGSEGGDFSLLSPAGAHLEWYTAILESSDTPWEEFWSVWDVGTGGAAQLESEGWGKSHQHIEIPGRVVEETDPASSQWSQGLGERQWVPTGIQEMTF